MLQGAQSRGLDVNRILRDSGMSPDVLRQGRSQVTFGQLARLELSLIELLDDETIGLLSTPQRRNTFKLCCYSIGNADTVGEALSLFAEFANLQDGSLIHDLSHEADFSTYRLRRRPGAWVKNNYIIELTLLTIHRVHCWMANKRIPLARVDFDFGRPEYWSEYRYLFYGAPIDFDHSSSSLVFRASDLSLPNVRNTADLKRFTRRAPLTLLTQTIDADELSTQVQQWVQHQLANHQQMPDIKSAAIRFELHPQSLRRRLGREGTSYRAIKLETRRDLAINLIDGREHSVETIAARLGYSEPAAFIRAFKHWTGLTPLAYRKLSG